MTTWDLVVQYGWIIFVYALVLAALIWLVCKHVWDDKAGSDAGDTHLTLSVDERRIADAHWGEMGMGVNLHVTPARLAVLDQVDSFPAGVILPLRNKLQLHRVQARDFGKASENLGDC